MRTRALSIGFFAVVATLAACGGSDAGRGAAGANGRPPGPRMVRRVEPADLFPSDLDLVLRVDMARMNAAIGPAAASELEARAGLEGEGDEILKDALGSASIVWVGLRLADAEAGDRVLIAEGGLAGLRPDPTTFRHVDTDLIGVSIADSVTPPQRSGTARIIQLGDRAIAFVSPIEVDSVARVLRDGPDERRGDPAREGIVSLDLRPRRLSASLEQRFPSIAAIIAGTRRVRAAVLPTDDGVRRDAEITARNKPAAERAYRFLSALRDNVEDPRYRDVMRALSLEQIEDTLRVRWPLPAKVLAALVQAPAEAP